MKRFYVLILYFIFKLSMCFCYAGKGVKRSTSDSSTYKTTEVCPVRLTTESLPTKRGKMNETSLIDQEPRRCDFVNPDDYYIRLTDYYISITKDVKERFEKLVWLINITKNGKYSTASEYILKKLWTIIFSIKLSQRFDFLVNFIEENYCCLDEKNNIVLSYVAYINEPYGVWVVVKKLLLKLERLTPKQLKYAQDIATRFYEEAKDYQRIAF